MADFGSQDDFFAQVDRWPTFLQNQSVGSCSNTPASIFSQNSNGSTDDLLERINDHDPDNEPRLSYSIEWRISHNGKKLPKDTESDVACTLETYWADVMKTKVEKYAAKKLAPHGNCHVEDTNVTMCVAHRSVRDLVKSYDGLNVEWRDLDRQISDRVAYRKPIRLEIIFNYVDSAQSDNDGPQGRQRGRTSATKSMLARRNRQIEAEESSGQPSVWVRVYNLMRCPGSPCHLGPYCWQDKDKKHYRMKSHHLRRLITAIQAGHVYEKHDDMPEDIREQLYAEEQQYLERKRKRDVSPPGRLPPIQITNVMPGGSDGAATMPRSPIEIPGPRDVNVGTYSDWHGSRVDDPILKQQFQLCGSLTLAEGYDLEQLWEEPNFQFLVDGGVKVGVAKRFMRDIKKWATDYAS